MTSDLDSNEESSTELRRRRTFRMRIWIGTALYLVASLALYQWGHAAGPWRLVWALLPLVFLVWNVIVVVLRVRQMDEYQVKLFFPGLAVGFAVAIVTAVGIGTLSSAGFAVPNSGWAVAVAGLVAWTITNAVTGAPKA